jgi:hypothetical protein
VLTSADRAPLQFLLQRFKNWSGRQSLMRWCPTI